VLKIHHSGTRCGLPLLDAGNVPLERREAEWPRRSNELAGASVGVFGSSESREALVRHAGTVPNVRTDGSRK
jgi:hypothetical protein